MRRPDDEEVARPGVHTGRHAQRNRADGAAHRARVLDEPLHVVRGAARAALVSVTREQEQQGVAAELEHVAAVALRDPDQPLEAAADQQDQLLGSQLAFAGEPFRQAREAGDVCRDERALDRARRRGRAARRPLMDQAREIRRESVPPSQPIRGYSDLPIFPVDRG